MRLKRLLLRARNNDLLNMFSQDNIRDEQYINKNLFGSSISIFSEWVYKADMQYASYDRMVAVFTKPISLSSRGNSRLFASDIIYAKTKENQAIVNVSTWEEVDQLDLFKGPVNRIKIFFVIYDNMIKFAVEDIYQSIPQSVLFEMMKSIIERCFLNSLTAEDGHTISVYNPDDFEILIDYSEEDFEGIFNSSKRKKKVVFGIDTQNEADELINSGQLVYSLKADSILHNVFAFARARAIQDGIVRYTIKCEDENGKTASIESVGNDILLDTWQTMPRISISDNATDEDLHNELFNFLGN
ncbi:hypothetical protein [Campylobacter mucosalis]|uniref:hypothetical protein n=1 Tax=Campylobacter mucosalis TaxID=202 RepID=UPI00147065A3|nr:hypothetical protein [Campylobacter mucosalis]